MINITFPDNSVRKYEKGITPYEIAKSISNSLAREVLSASHDDEIIEVGELNSETNNSVTNKILKKIKNDTN